MDSGKESSGTVTKDTGVGTPPKEETKSSTTGRKPTTTIIQSKNNRLEKETTNGGPDRGYSGGGKQGQYRQPC